MNSITSHKNIAKFIIKWPITVIEMIENRLTRLLQIFSVKCEFQWKCLSDYIWRSDERTIQWNEFCYKKTKGFQRSYTKKLRLDDWIIFITVERCMNGPKLVKVSLSNVRWSVYATVCMRLNNIHFLWNKS